MASNAYNSMQGMKEALASIVAAYAYISEPWMIVYQTNILIGFVRSMLVTLAADDDAKDVVRARFRGYRSRWKTVAFGYQETGGVWQKAVGICGEIYDEVLEEAVSNDLISSKEGTFDLGRHLKYLDTVGDNVGKWK